MKSFMQGGEVIGGVQCFFDDKHKDELSKLSKGDRVTIRGKCEGGKFNVSVKRCEFVK